MKPFPKCATRECRRPHSARSEWCAPCRTSMRRFIRATPADRRAAWARVRMRLARLSAFTVEIRRGHTRAA
jgi:hypothetical protein